MNKGSSPLLDAISALAAVVLLCGCTSGQEPTSTATATAQASKSSYPMPDIGPSPTPTPQTSAEKAAQLQDVEDERWAAVVATYPQAQRPSVEFEGFVNAKTMFETLSKCYTAAGVPYSVAQDSNGGQLVEPEAATEGQAIAAFVCESEHPTPLPHRPTAAELGYIYDYLVQFIVPCYASHGAINAPPPTREQYIALWPHQNWFPTVADPVMPEEEDAIYDDCPLLN